MTKEEKIIATAFTGKMFIDGSEMGPLYEYMEKKVGHGVSDLMLANKEFWEELHKACEQDFIDMVSKEQPSLSSGLDEAAEEFYKEIECYPPSLPLYNKHVRNAFKAGAEWMAGQGITAKSKVCKLAERAWVTAINEKQLQRDIYDNFAAGDKVIVQIRKKQ